MRVIRLFLLWILALSAVTATDKDKLYKLIGSAFVDNSSYLMLEKLCYVTGGRLAGSINNHKAMDILENELKKIDLKPRRESFMMPGWNRGEDRVMMTCPSFQEIRASALGYSEKKPEIHSELVFVNYGMPDDYKTLDVKGKIVLANQGYKNNGQTFLRCQAIKAAASQGAAAILFINEKAGGLVLAGVGDFNGNPTPIPAFTITNEDGLRLKWLCEKKVKTELTIITNSYCPGAIKEDNLIVTIPGKSKKKIVIGAHFDSWDISQGAVDNGHGIAIAFEIARLVSQFSPDNNLTIEIVWFNAEETGLWGSRSYVEQHKSDDIALMFNLDMTGIVTGFNLMGFDELTPIFQNICTGLNGFNLKDGVNSALWINSDHTYFVFEGIPCITLNGSLEKDMYWYYHDYSDSFDKVKKEYLSQPAAVLSVVVTELANSNVVFPKKSREEVKSLLQKFKLEESLKNEGQWPFE